jgi:hypothetical protein
MTRRVAARRALAGLLLVLLTACAGLPVPSGVRNAEGVRGDAPDVGGIVVVAPGPQPAATALQLVQGFLYALSRSPQDDHRIARQFLAPDVECCDESEEAVLYPVGGVNLSVLEDPSVVRASFDSVGRILRDGSFRLEEVVVRDDFRVATVDGELRLASVPRGLRLVVDDLERSYTPYDVHFLASDEDGSPSGRLVPDRVFLPASREPGRALVAALLAGPTRRLAPAVLSAAPPGTTAEVQADSGIVTVDLSAEAATLDTRARQRLAAQLVWTLVPDYSGVRLLVEGAPLVPEEEPVQDRADWAVYDPSGASDDAPLLYLQDRRLHRLDRELTESAVTTGELPVDEAALSLSGTDLAVRTRRPGGVDELRTGPLRGPFEEPVLRGPGLGSLSWGPGEQGLWVLQTGTQAGVWLVPVEGGPDRAPQRVAVQVPRDAGPLSTLRVSRDGARVALVLGGRLHVGRIEAASPGWLVGDVTLASRELVGVTDVAWRSGTTLVALGAFEDDGQLFPAEVSVDGSSFDVVQRPLVGAVAVEIAAAPRQPLVVAADVEGRRQLYRDDDTLFRLVGPGRSPFYPG